MKVIDLSALSLVGGSGIAESKIPLWWASGTDWTNSGATSAGQQLLLEGNLSSNASFTLSSNWPYNLQFAFEATIASSGSATCYACLWDKTSNSSVVNSTVSTTSTTMTVVRSNKFNLIPGHSYSGSIWSSSSSVNSGASDASLIIFP